MGSGPWDRWDRWDMPRRLLAVLAGVLAVATVLGGILLWPHGDLVPDKARDVGVQQDLFEGTVQTSSLVACEATQDIPDGPKCQRVTFEVAEGPDLGLRFTQEFPDVDSAPDLEPGERVLLSRLRQEVPGLPYSYRERLRKPALLWLALIFAVLVVALGRLRGVAALIGLVASLGVLLTFVLPAILSGRPPVWVTLVGATAIAFLALYISHGVRMMTTVALVGTVAGLGLTALLAAVFSELAQLSGFVSDEAFFLSAVGVDVNVSGLLLGGMVIGSLGVIDDATVTQASAVWELRAANPAMSHRELMRAGLRIGQAHVSAMVNTLVLAYAGASLPLMILFVLSAQSLGTVANNEAVAVEIVRTLVGSIGLIAAVPMTTALAVLCSRSSTRAPSDGEDPEFWGRERR